jgi:hypothetical protein
LALGGEKKSSSLCYFGTPDKERERALSQASRRTSSTPEAGAGRGGRAGGGDGREARPSVMNETVLTPNGKLWKPLGANWQAGPAGASHKPASL